jgi:hypothetical protein
MSSQPVDRLHPVVELAERLAQRLDSLAETPLCSMTPEEQRRALTALTADEARLTALKLRLLAEADRSEATAASGAASAADWLAVETRQVRREARSDLRLAARLEDHPVLSAAMGRGQVNPAQARAIVASLERLPRPASSPSPLTNARPRRPISWRWRRTTTPRRCASWAATCSR